MSFLHGEINPNNQGSIQPDFFKTNRTGPGMNLNTKLRNSDEFFGINRINILCHMNRFTSERWTTYNMDACQPSWRDSARCFRCFVLDRYRIRKFCCSGFGPIGLTRCTFFTSNNIPGVSVLFLKRNQNVSLDAMWTLWILDHPFNSGMSSKCFLDVLGRPVWIPTRPPSTSTNSRVFFNFRFGLSDTEHQTFSPGSFNLSWPRDWGSGRFLFRFKFTSARKRL